MLSLNKSLQILNPDVYLNHVSPVEAHQVEVRRDITYISLGATLWDMFTYIYIDIEIMRHSRFTLVNFCFIFSRLFAAGHVSMLAINIVPNNFIYLFSGCLCMMSITASTFLFLQRVLAVYSDNKKVKWCFWILWVMGTISSIIIPFGGHQTTIPGTHQNKDSDLRPWVSIPVWFLFLFDSAVIGAMSYQILFTCSVLREKQRLSWYNLLTGKTLPGIARAIFQGGIQYYLITVGVVLLEAFAIALPSVPQIYKATVSAAMVPLTASMACRIFRNTRLFYSENVTVQPMATLTDL